jgi:predicted nucleic acid-binding protein
MNLVSFRELQLYYCTDILDEYKRALAYERLKIPMSAQNKAIAGITSLGILVTPTASMITMPDESDRVFYDTAVTGNAFLITGNTKHFPSESTIMTPADFLVFASKETPDDLLVPIRRDIPPK